MTLQFLQLNMNKAGAAASELHRLLPTKDYGVLLLSEPPVYKNKVVTLPKGYRVFPSNSLDTVPRAALMIRSDLRPVFLPHLSTADGAAALIPTPLGTLLVASVYLDKTLPVNPDWLQSIYSYATARRYGVIIGYDANAHHTTYGFRTDARGKEFLEVMNANALSIANQGKTPTFDTVRAGQLQQSIIDITAFSGAHINNWRVDTQYNGSDHNTILFDVPHQLPPATEGRRWSKANWPLFTELLLTAPLYTPKMVNHKKLDNMVRNLYRAINAALDKACPKENITPPKPYSHWYDSDLKKLSRKLRKQYRRTKRSPNDDESSKLHKLQQEYSQSSKSKRRLAWRSHLTEADSVKSVAQLNKVLQYTDRHSINLFQKSDGTFTEPGPESAEFLFRTHFPTAAPITPIKYSSDSNTPTAVPLEKYTSWINARLVRKALAGFQDKKSPGPDGLKPVIFKYLPPRVLAYITSIYRISVYLQYTPLLWKQTRVIFIPKPGKKSYLEPSPLDRFHFRTTSSKASNDSLPGVSMRPWCMPLSTPINMGS